MHLDNAAHASRGDAQRRDETAAALSVRSAASRFGPTVMSSRNPQCGVFPLFEHESRLIFRQEPMVTIR